MSDRPKPRIRATNLSVSEVAAISKAIRREPLTREETLILRDLLERTGNPTPPEDD